MFNLNSHTKLTLLTLYGSGICFITNYLYYNKRISSKIIKILNIKNKLYLKIIYLALFGIIFYFMAKMINIEGFNIGAQGLERLEEKQDFLCGKAEQEKGAQLTPEERRRCNLLVGSGGSSGCVNQMNQCWNDPECLPHSLIKTIRWEFRAGAADPNDNRWVYKELPEDLGYSMIRDMDREFFNWGDADNWWNCMRRPEVVRADSSPPDHGTANDDEQVRHQAEDCVNGDQCTIEVGSPWMMHGSVNGTCYDGVCKECTLNQQCIAPGDQIEEIVTDSDGNAALRTGCRLVECAPTHLCHETFAEDGTGCNLIHEDETVDHGLCKNGVCSFAEWIKDPNGIFRENWCGREMNDCITAHDEVAKNALPPSWDTLLGGDQNERENCMDILEKSLQTEQTEFDLDPDNGRPILPSFLSRPPNEIGRIMDCYNRSFRPARRQGWGQVQSDTPPPNWPPIWKEWAENLADINNEKQTCLNTIETKCNPNHDYTPYIKLRRCLSDHCDDECLYCASEEQHNLKEAGCTNSDIHTYCSTGNIPEVGFEEVKESCWIHSRQLKVGYELLYSNTEPYDDRQNSWVVDGLADSKNNYNLGGQTAQERASSYIGEPMGYAAVDYQPGSRRREYESDMNGGKRICENVIEDGTNVRSKRCARNCSGCYAYYDGSEEWIKDNNGETAIGYYTCKDYEPPPGAATDSRRVCEIDLNHSCSCLSWVDGVGCYDPQSH